MENFFDEASGIAGSIRDDGPGRPLVLLHSLAMHRGLWTEELLERFGTGRRLILVDQPGHGESPIRDTRTIEGMADRVAQALEALGIGSAAVVGVSMGGCVAQALAIHHPRYVAALGLADTTSNYADPEAWEQRAATAREKGFPSMAGFQASRWFTEAFCAEHPEEIDRLLGIFSSMDIDAYEAACAALGAVDLTAELSAIEVPAAVVVGAEDYATPVAHAEVIARGIRGASLTVLPGASHLAIIEKSEAVFAALKPVLTA